jgi:abequosyltransferase
MSPKQSVLLSICIPTYNRASYIAETLSSLQKQVEKHLDGVEIVISDNNSTDSTWHDLQGYAKKHKNTRIYKNKKNIGADLNVMKVASYARGTYIWFLSDDDIPYPNAIKNLLQKMQETKPDALLCNLDLVDKKGKKIIARNLLSLNQDVTLRTRKELFSFLEGKFMLPIDWYTTSLSNTIVSRSLYRQNAKHVLSLFTAKHNNFLHSGLIYYAAKDLKIQIIARPLLKFRSDNRSFGPDERMHKAEYLQYILTTFSAHNHLLYHFNHDVMSVRFKFLLFSKDVFRWTRIQILKIFKIDVLSPTSST